MALDPSPASEASVGRVARPAQAGGAGWGLFLCSLLGRMLSREAPPPLTPPHHASAWGEGNRESEPPFRPTYCYGPGA